MLSILRKYFIDHANYKYKWGQCFEEYFNQARVMTTEIKENLSVQSRFELVAR
jgi:hypothetical protein